MRIYNNNTYLRFKTINSTNQVQNRQAGCSSSLQPESFAISYIENHCCIG